MAGRSAAFMHLHRRRRKPQTHIAVAPPPAAQLPFNDRAAAARQRRSSGAPVARQHRRGPRTVPGVIADVQVRLEQLTSLRRKAAIAPIDGGRPVTAFLRYFDNELYRHSGIMRQLRQLLDPGASGIDATVAAPGTSHDAEAEARARMLEEEELRLKRWEQELARAAGALSRARTDVQRLHRLLRCGHDHMQQQHLLDDDEPPATATSDGGDDDPAAKQSSYVHYLQQRRLHSLTSAVAAQAHSAGLSDRRIAELRNAFCALDADGSGTIDLPEFARALGSSALHARQLTAEEVEAQFRTADIDGNGEIDFSEFVAAVSATHQETSYASSDVSAVRAQLCHDVFAIVDRQQSGALREGELQRALAIIGHTHGRAAVAWLASEFDEDNNGCTELEEFEHIIGFLDSGNAPPSHLLPQPALRVARKKARVALERRRARAAATRAAAAASIAQWWREILARRKLMSRRRFLADLLSLGVIHPGGAFITAWALMILVMMAGSAMLVPFRITFESDASAFTQVLDYAMEVAFMLDIYLSMHLGFEDPATGDLVLDPALVRTAYMRSWLCLDVVSGVPVELISIVEPRMSAYTWTKALKIFKVLRLLKLTQLPVLRRLEHHSPNSFRMWKVTILICFVLHVMACAYWAMVRHFCVRPRGLHSTALGQPQLNFDYKQDAFCPFSNTTVSLGSYDAKYVEAGYWSLVTILGNGETRFEQEGEYAVLCVVLLLGIFTSGAILGAISLLLSTLDVASAERDSEIAIVRQYFASHSHNHPPLIEERVVQFFQHQWEAGTAPYYEQLLSRIPASLTQDLTLVLKKRLIEMVPMFCNCRPGTTLALIRCLKSTTAIPGETIMLEGAPGDCMYFLASGRVSVSHLDTNGARVLLVELTDGAFFGELALLGDSVRSATVTAAGFCELERLEYSDFDALLRERDDLLALVIECAKVRIDRLRKSYKDGRLAGVQASPHVMHACSRRLLNGSSNTSRHDAGCWAKAASYKKEGKASVFELVRQAATASHKNIFVHAAVDSAKCV